MALPEAEELPARKARKAPGSLFVLGYPESSP